MELRANTTDRVCTECGKKVGDWVITFYWGGQGICLCDEHYDALQCLMPKPKKPEKGTQRVTAKQPKAKQPRKVVY